MKISNGLSLGSQKLERNIINSEDKAFIIVTIGALVTIISFSMPWGIQVHAAIFWILMLSCSIYTTIIEINARMVDYEQLFFLNNNPFWIEEYRYV